MLTSFIWAGVLEGLILGISMFFVEQTQAQEESFNVNICAFPIVWHPRSATTIDKIESMYSENSIEKDS